jgi:hypothetical protein
VGAALFAAYWLVESDLPTKPNVPSGREEPVVGDPGVPVHPVREEVPREQVVPAGAPPVTVAPVPLRYSPSAADLRALKTARRFADEVGLEFPESCDLDALDWESVKKIITDTNADLGDLDLVRTRLMTSIMDERAALGRLEVSRLGAVPAAMSPAERRALVDAEKPNAPGQMVSLRLSEDVRYVCRVNPGEVPALDSANDQARSLKLLAAAGVLQIIESKSNRVGK